MKHARPGDADLDLRRRPTRRWSAGLVLPDLAAAAGVERAALVAVVTVRPARRPRA